MADRIQESELAGTELRGYTDFLVAAPGEEGSGVPVFSIRVLPPFVGAGVQAPTTEVRQLVIEVADPDSPETIDRVRAAITDLTRQR